jgi:hypothetical protein
MRLFYYDVFAELYGFFDENGGGGIVVVGGMVGGGWLWNGGCGMVVVEWRCRQRPYTFASLGYFLCRLFVMEQFRCVCPVYYIRRNSTEKNSENLQFCKQLFTFFCIFSYIYENSKVEAGKGKRI